MAESSALSWSELSDWRSECHSRFGTLLELPIVAIDVEMRRLLAEADHVLDIGAGRDRPLHSLVDAERTVYRSLDTDPRGTFDFSDLSEVPADERFDTVVANQILEHVTVPDAMELVRGVAEIITPGGRFAATVPNAAHPVRQWDPTHLTPWPVFDFYGLFRMAGFEVERVARYGKRRLPRRPIRRMIVKAVAEEFRVDWCDSILLVARRPA